MTKKEEELIKLRIWKWVNLIAPGIRIVIPIKGVRRISFEKQDMVDAIYKVGKSKK